MTVTINVDKGYSFELPDAVYVNMSHEEKVDFNHYCNMAALSLKNRGVSTPNIISVKSTDELKNLIN
jgi:hypothetical protein